MKVALVAGATGLVGKQLLHLLLKDPEYHHVKALTRSPWDINDPKLESVLVDFNKLSEYGERLSADDVFCCLGTTMKKAGSKEAFYRVDYTYPLELAKVTQANGAKQYLLVSALGADKDSSIYYNKVKGEVEEAIGKVPFTSYHIFRPSLLLGSREENRSGEEAAKVVYKIFGFLIPKRLKAIDSLKVAKAMLHFARKEEEGKQMHESVTLQNF